jgi:hypothetical protein
LSEQFPAIHRPVAQIVRGHGLAARIPGAAVFTLPPGWGELSGAVPARACRARLGLSRHLQLFVFSSSSNHATPALNLRWPSRGARQHETGPILEVIVAYAVTCPQILTYDTMPSVSVIVALLLRARVVDCPKRVDAAGQPLQANCITRRTRGPTPLPAPHRWPRGQRLRDARHGPLLLPQVMLL